MSTFDERWAAAHKLFPNDLPEQPMIIEEMVDRCNRNVRRKTALQLFSHMRILIAKSYCDNFLNNCSMKDLWMIYMMKAIFNRKWNNDKRIWEERD